jgi:hypothetical protein
MHEPESLHSYIPPMGGEKPFVISLVLEHFCWFPWSAPYLAMRFSGAFEAAARPCALVVSAIALNVAAPSDENEMLSEDIF